MASASKKPVGYIQKILAMDCESSGLTFNGDDPSDGFQSISWGFIVADALTLKPIEELYVEIKWDGVSGWQKRAEKIHGLSKAHLEEHGVTEQEAVEKIGTLILKHWGPENCIHTLGHNVTSFDLWFLRRLFRGQGVELKFGNRHYDTNTIGWIAVDSFTSRQFFEGMGLEYDEVHNALIDTRLALEAARRVKTILQKAIG